MDTVSALLSLRWPTDATGYCIFEAHDTLPPYYLLTQRLRERGVTREPHWTKDDCLAHLEDVPDVVALPHHPFSGYFCQQIVDHLRLQSEFLEKSKGTTVNLGHDVQDTFAKNEAANLERQLAMMDGS
jgi:hypothetical protein